MASSLNVLWENRSGEPQTYIGEHGIQTGTHLKTIAPGTHLPVQSTSPAVRQIRMHIGKANAVSGPSQTVVVDLGVTDKAAGDENRCHAIGTVTVSERS